MLYLASLFDVDKAIEASVGMARAGEQEEAVAEWQIQANKHLLSSEEINALVMHNRETFSEIKAMIDSYLNKNGRRYVSMDSLFGFMSRMALWATWTVYHWSCFVCLVLYRHLYRSFQ
jgi:hypothetical protein